MKKYFKNNFFIFLFLIGCNSESSIEVLEKSRNLINEQKYSEAISELSSLINKYPNSIEASESQYLIADTYAFLNN